MWGRKAMVPLGIRALNMQMMTPLESKGAIPVMSQMRGVGIKEVTLTQELNRGYHDSLYPPPVKVWKPDPPKAERQPVSGEESMNATLENLTMDQMMVELRASVPRESNGEEFNAAKTERISNAVSVGDVVRQGDLYFECIEKLPAGGKVTNNRQLVPGTTQGSRHILEGDCKIVKDVQFKRMNATLVGPAFECVGDVTATHPEHGHKVFPAGTFWQTYGQQAYDQEMIRRVRD